MGVSCREPLLNDILPTPLLLTHEPSQSGKKKNSDKILGKDEERKLFLVDATEQVIERPKCTKKQREFYSGKKKRHTLKTQFVTTKEGYIEAISESVAGKVHDKRLCVETDTLDLLPDGAWVYVDKGYQGLKKHVGKGIYELEDGSEGNLERVWVRIPLKKEKGLKQSEGEKEWNRELSQVRIKVEHAIGKVKHWGILGGRFRCSHEVYGDIMQLLCGFINQRSIGAGHMSELV